MPADPPLILAGNAGQLGEERSRAGLRYSRGDVASSLLASPTLPEERAAVGRAGRGGRGDGRSERRSRAVARSTERTGGRAPGDRVPSLPAACRSARASRLSTLRPEASERAPDARQDEVLPADRLRAEVSASRPSRTIPTTGSRFADRRSVPEREKAAPGPRVRLAQARRYAEELRDVHERERAQRRAVEETLSRLEESYRTMVHALARRARAARRPDRRSRRSGDRLGMRLAATRWCRPGPYPVR